MRTVTLLLPLLLTGCQAESVQLGAGEFQRSTLPTGQDPYSITTADMNGDTHPDLVITSRDQQVTVFLGDGQGTFNAQASAPTGPNPGDIDAADITGDGHPDVVLPNHETMLVSVLRGNGRGGLRPMEHSPLPIPVDPHPHVVRLRDMTGDGLPDLLYDNRMMHAVGLMEGRGDGTFSPTAHQIQCGGDPYRGFVIGDFNEDGHLDLATPNPGAIGVVLARPDRRDRFRFHRPHEFRLPSAFALATGDVNGDGHIDIAAATDGVTSAVHVLLGDGDGGFREAERRDVTLPAGGKSIATGDLNGDNADDIVAASWNGHELLVVFGSLSNQPAAPLRLPAGETPWGVTLSDLNEDGLADIVVLDHANAEAILYLSTR